VLGRVWTVAGFIRAQVIDPGSGRATLADRALDDDCAERLVGLPGDRLGAASRAARHVLKRFDLKFGFVPVDTRGNVSTHGSLLRRTRCRLPDLKVRLDPFWTHERRGSDDGQSSRCGGHA
jgi:hypothetical protein